MASKTTSTSSKIATEEKRLKSLSTLSFSEQREKITIRRKSTTALFVPKVCDEAKTTPVQFTSETNEKSCGNERKSTDILKEEKIEKVVCSQTLTSKDKEKKSQSETDTKIECVSTGNEKFDDVDDGVKDDKNKEKKLTSSKEYETQLDEKVTLQKEGGIDKKNTILQKHGYFPDEKNVQDSSHKNVHEKLTKTKMSNGNISKVASQKKLLIKKTTHLCDRQLLHTSSESLSSTNNSKLNDKLSVSKQQTTTQISHIKLRSHEQKIN